MHRFFINSISSKKDKLIITGGEAHHLATVLRLQPGTEVELLNGTGMVTVAEITSISRGQAEMRVIRQYVSIVEDLFPLTLAQAVLKGKKMDIILEKASELGVSTFIPILSRYSQPGKGLARRMDRWQRIAINASKQCGRETPITIFPPCPFEELVTSPYKYRIFCWEKQKKNIIKPDFFHSSGRTLLLVGPEGGFHEEEEAWAIKHEFTPVSLGPLILRAETAAISAVSVIRYLCLLKTRQNLGVGNK